MTKLRIKIACFFLAICYFFSFSVAPVLALINYSYDQNGNMASDGQYCYTYNEANQVSKVKNCSNSQLVAEYLYDYTGRRIVKKEYENGNLKQTVYSPDKNYETKKLPNNSTSNQSYYYVNDELVARKNSDGSKVFYQNDHLGSTSILTDASGNLVEETSYYPYGEIRLGGTNSKYLFTGQEKDIETGLNYYGARYYNSHIASFTQPDSLIPNPYDPQQLNRYAYARNNPLRYTDPSGHCIWDLCLLELAIAVPVLAPPVIALANHPEIVEKVVYGMIGMYNTGKALGDEDYGSALLNAGPSLYLGGSALNDVKFPGAGLSETAVSKKTFQIYEKPPPPKSDMPPYIGRTSGNKSPKQNVQQRDYTSQMNEFGYGPAKLLYSSSNPNPIRGAENILINQSGGPIKSGGTSSNRIWGISLTNPKQDVYYKAAWEEFGLKWSGWPSK